MADYREMYLHLMRETEKALRILIEASGNVRKCTSETAVLLCGSFRRQSRRRMTNFPRFGHPMENPSKRGAFPCVKNEPASGPSP